MVLLLFLLVIGFIRFIMDRKVISFAIVTLCLLAIAFYNLRENLRSAAQKLIVFYDVPGRSYFDVFIGEDCYTNQVINDSNEVVYNLAPNRRNHFIDGIYPIDSLAYSRTIQGKTLIFYDDLKVLIVRDFIQGAPLPGVRFDYVVIGKNSLPFLEEIKEVYEYDCLVLDASISTSSLRFLKSTNKFAEKMHSIAENGALRISI